MFRMKLWRSAATAVALLVASSCGTDPAGPNLNTRGVHVIAGGLSDTITARPVQALIVAVRSEGGAPAVGKVVRFTSLGSGQYPFPAQAPIIYTAPLASNSFGSFVADTTDESSLAKVLLSFGTKVGEAKLEVSVPEIGLSDTITFTIQPGAPHRAQFNIRDTLLLTGASYSLSASLVDRFNNPRTETATLHNLSPTLCSLSGSQVAANAMGRCMIEAQHGTMRDTARASILPLARLAVVNTYSSLGLTMTVGGNVKQILPIHDAVLSPGWAPDASALVIYEGDAASGAHVSIVDTNGVRLFTIGSGTQMALAALGRFSPDGQWVYFSGRVAPSDPMTIWRMRPNGSDRTVVTTNSETGTLQLRVSASPDGATIAYDALGQIILGNVNTLQPTPTGVAGIAPSFSPDGQSIVFFGLNGTALQVMNKNGTNVRTVLADAYFMEWQPPQWTADGNWLLVSGPRFVNVATGTVMPIPGVYYEQVALKPPLGR
jgi:hypothetical protein